MQLNQEFTKAQLHVACQFAEREQPISWQLFDPQGKLITEQKGHVFHAEIENAQIMACGEPSFIHIDFAIWHRSNLSKSWLASYRSEEWVNVI